MTDATPSTAQVDQITVEEVGKSLARGEFDDTWAGDALTVLMDHIATLQRERDEARAQLVTARGHNGANVNRGEHPIHPRYGCCDAFENGGACSECTQIFAAQARELEAARASEEFARQNWTAFKGESDRWQDRAVKAESALAVAERRLGAMRSALEECRGIFRGELRHETADRRIQHRCGACGVWLDWDTAPEHECDALAQDESDT